MQPLDLAARRSIDINPIFARLIETVNLPAQSVDLCLLQGKVSKSANANASTIPTAPPMNSACGPQSPVAPEIKTRYIIQKMMALALIIAPLLFTLLRYECA